jgi:hypothetical protein
MLDNAIKTSTAWRSAEFAFDHKTKNYSLDEGQTEAYNAILERMQQLDESKLNQSPFFPFTAENFAHREVAVDKGLSQFKFKGLKDLYTTMSINADGSFTQAELQQAILQLGADGGYNAENIMGMWYSAHFDTIYKELLITEVLSLIEEIDHNKKIAELYQTKMIEEIASEYLEKKPADLSSKDKLNTLCKIRNAFTHGSYINSVGDKIEIYDQINNKNTQKEYKFTIYLDELEQIKKDCITIFKEQSSGTQNTL